VLSDLLFVAALYNHIMKSNGFGSIIDIGGNSLYNENINQWMTLAASSTIAGNITIL